MRNRSPAGPWVMVHSHGGCRYELSSAQSAYSPRRCRFAAARPRPVSQLIVDLRIPCSLPLLEVVFVLRQVVAELVGDVSADGLHGARE